jgi:hypothetical protein
MTKWPARFWKNAARLDEITLASSTACIRNVSKVGVLDNFNHRPMWRGTRTILTAFIRMQLFKDWAIERRIEQHFTLETGILYRLIA